MHQVVHCKRYMYVKIFFFNVNLPEIKPGSDLFKREPRLE